MKRIKIIIVLLFLSAVVFGQSTKPAGKKYYTSSDYGWQWPRIKGDSAMAVPIGLSLRGAARDTGEIRYNIADSTVYVHTGNIWIKAVRATGGSTDSATFKTVWRARQDSAAIMQSVALKLNKSDSTAGGYYPYSTNPKGYLTGNKIDSIRSVKSLLFNSPSTFTLNGTTGVITETLASQAANSVFRTTTAGTPSFGTLDSTHVPALHSEGYYNTKFAAVGSGVDSTAYHTVSVINDSSFVLCDLHSNCDTIVIAGTDTSSLSNRINQRVKYTDTTSMLSAYQTAINTNTANIALKLNKTDTTGMRAQLIAGSNVTITGTYPTLTIASSGGSSGWGLTGNATTFPNTYLGTTGSATIRFITNNVQRMMIDSVGRTFVDSTYFGRGTGTNYNNVAIGDSTLLRNTTGNGLTVIGDSALRLNTSGFDNTAIGNKAGAAITTTGGNTLVGSNAGLTLTSTANTAVGNEALKAAAGNFNTAVGFHALMANTAAYNVAVGVNALLSNTSGTGNTAVGTNAGMGITTSSNITSIGYQSNLTATGASNTSVGSGSGVSLTSGGNNTFVGVNAGIGITTGSHNTMIGFPAANSPASRSNWVQLFDGQGNTAFTRDSLNRVGLGTINTPAALLHIAAGTTSIAPIRLTSGTNLTTPVAGSIEYDGTNLFFTRTGTTRESVITANAVNTVSPTLPNRTITVVIDGTTYYLYAKTTND